ncbi:hypothetical protein ODJ79_34995 [Actinoplanes sp. KI2]|uniref:hypothetical protein n=1 Tax=Actinoplanes sp. KI2 TaxID=2983315 RepID=UPI0021D60445|nr:hypothetical protein [Actinoplanes sp. KI2]MCU7728948.1 hypothetical protein [Actinoplanes sp. KI2]
MDVDPLRQEDVLHEAQLLSARLDALSSTVGLLFELRTAMNLMEGNTAVLAARGVREFTWSADEQYIDKTAWNIVGSEPQYLDGIFVLKMAFLPVARMRLVATSAAFYVGDVVGLAEQLPDYVEDDEATIAGNLPNWQSVFEPIWATRIDDSLV